MSFSVLLAEDETTLREVMTQALTGIGCCVEATPSGTKALELLSLGSFDLVLTDIRLPGASGMDVLRACRDQHPATTVMLVTAYATVEQAVSALKQGAHQYLRKPFEMDELLHHVAQLIERRRLEGEIAALRDEVSTREELSGILGSSAAMAQVRELIRTVSDGSSNVLITGPSGGGKSLAARAIHRLGPRRDEPLVTVNCAAIPETLLESQLFGHEAGAFTGATRQHRGHFEQAHKGTLLLDEIGDLSLTAQAKLLQVIQDRTFHRIGGGRPVEVDVRVISASNQPLLQSVKTNAFRLDLYYRIAVVEVRLPALAERPEDIPALVACFLRRFSARAGKSIGGISPEAWALLCSYPFPGNVRELENAIERAVLLCRGGEILPAHLPPAFTQHVEPPLAGAPTPLPLKDALHAFETSYIVRTLTECGYNKTVTAQALGISRKHLWTKMQQLGIDPGQAE